MKPSHTLQERKLCLSLCKIMNRGRNINKQMVENYRKILDQQVAHIERRPKDLIEGNDLKTLQGFISNQSLDSPIYFPGSVVGDPKYDINMNKFLEKEKVLSKSFIMDNYDDNAFKKRTLERNKANQIDRKSEIQAKDQVEYQNPQSRSLKHLENGTSLKISEPQKNLISLKEKYKANSPAEMYQNSRIVNKLNRSRLNSRDERLAAPKSTHIKLADKNNNNGGDKQAAVVNQHVSFAKPSQYTMNPSVTDSPYKAAFNKISVDNQNSKSYESINSRRKRLLQISNQIGVSDPFIKNRLPTHAAYIQKQLGRSQLAEGYQ